MSVGQSTAPGLHRTSDRSEISELFGRVEDLERVTPGLLTWASFAHSADVPPDIETDVPVVTTVGDAVRYSNPFPNYYQFVGTDGGSFRIAQAGMYMVELVCDFRVEDTVVIWRAVSALNVTLGSGDIYLNGAHPIKLAPHSDGVSGTTNIVLPTVFLLHLTSPPYDFQVRLFHDAPVDAAVLYYLTAVRLGTTDIVPTYSNELPL
jgi:hypothetical protein